MDLIGYQGTEAETPLEFQLEAHTSGGARHTQYAKEQATWRLSACS